MFAALGILTALGFALAAEPVLLPALAPIDAPEQYAKYLKDTGRPPAELACESLWTESALLCFKMQTGNKRRWLTRADLEKRQWSFADVRQRVTTAAATQQTAKLMPAAVPGLEGATYWISTGGDGWATAALLDPAAIAERLGGGPFLVAAPTETVLIAWKPGNADLDRVIAVGVREMYDSQEGPVTAVVHQWDGERFVAYAEAKPTVTGAPMPR